MAESIRTGGKIPKMASFEGNIAKDRNLLHFRCLFDAGFGRNYQRSWLPYQGAKLTTSKRP